MKTCCACREPKPLTEFWKMAQKKDGLEPRCKPCAKEQKQASAARRKAADPKGEQTRRRGYVAKYKRIHPDRVKLSEYKQNLRQKFNLTFADYELMLARQNGKCAICENPPRTRRLAVDHDKLTGQIRGLLCGNCNTGIGLFYHLPTNLQSAITYLAFYSHGK